MKTIEHRATEVAKEILSRNYVDVGELSAALKVTISLTIEDLLRSEVEGLQERKTDLSSIIHNPYAGKFQKETAHAELVKVSKELKKKIKVIHLLEEDSEKTNLKRFIKKKYGSSFWEEFKEFKNKKNNNANN